MSERHDGHDTQKRPEIGEQLYLGYTEIAQPGIASISKIDKLENGKYYVWFYWGDNGVGLDYISLLAEQDRLKRLYEGRIATLDTRNGSKDEIRLFISNAKKRNATHLIVYEEDFKYYYRDVMPNQNARLVAERCNVVEIYNLNLDIESQLNEKQAKNF